MAIDAAYSSTSKGYTPTLSAATQASLEKGRQERAAKAAGLYLSPGVATPTEAFAALAEGADVLKMFPAEQMGPAVVKAWLAVLPAGTLLIPVGGITPDNMQVFLDAGVSGFGLGSGLFKPGMSAEDVAVTAKAYVQAWNARRKAD